MNKKQWAICPHCHRWNETPPSFHELEHFCQCSCGELMFLIRENPKEAAYREIDKTNITLVNQ